MNSVFSAFKKADKHQNLHQQNNNNSSQTFPPLSPTTIDHHRSNKGKKMLNVQENTYENLRHIREIGSPNSIIMPTTSSPPPLITNLLTTGTTNDHDCDEVSGGSDVVDHSLHTNAEQNFNYTQICDKKKQIQPTQSPSLATADEDDESTISDSITCSGNCTSSSSELSNNTVKHTVSDNDCDSSDVDDCDDDLKQHKEQHQHQQQQQQAPQPKSPISLLKKTTNNFTVPVIMSKNRVCRNDSAPQPQTGTHSASNTPKTMRYGKPRLSLSGFNGSLNSMPSIHGRPNANGAGNGGQTETNSSGQPKRLLTHQRNLSLDFR